MYVKSYQYIELQYQVNDHNTLDYENHHEDIALKKFHCLNIVHCLTRLDQMLHHELFLSNVMQL